MEAMDAKHARIMIWEELRKVARPDSRFSWDFGEFIADYEGSDKGAELLAQQAVFPIVETEDEYDINEDAPLTIAETEANIPVCSVSDAVMRMDLADECAIMFKNISNGHISMVYRRKDGNIGWVEPKAQ